MTDIQRAMLGDHERSGEADGARGGNTVPFMRRCRHKKYVCLRRVWI